MSATIIRSVFAQNMRRGRKALRINQMKLAERAKISASFVAEIETCRKFPSPEVLERIAAALEMLPYQLFLSPDQWEIDDQIDVLQNLYGNLRERLHSEIDSILTPYTEK